ncbi:hypothetical protein [Kingella sp. (in: b-proteobacteria)]|uniref:hypothetical protein n=1 Tax=Kingella sp. (in: b-proteobacteria) TaxID=2020713 RepID=UPI0026DCA5FF|nr:hypothetical protein [Kingella sp. (in: b-proteobacteria)]MDO4657839.1 hypothetical protein [Kingella sp. (in: b-proteobacteria)]
MVSRIKCPFAQHKGSLKTSAASFCEAKTALRNVFRLPFAVRERYWLSLVR